MKFKLLTSALAAILGLALAGAPVTSQAQTSTPKSASTKAAKISYQGTLTAVDASSITVQASSGPLTLVISSKTKILKDKQPATITDFAVGDEVTGSYTKDATSGTLTASSLHKKTADAASSPTSAPDATSGATTTPAPAPAQ